MNLPEDRMSEAEVAIGLAEYLLGLPGAVHEVSVAVDGAVVRIQGAEVFPMAEYLDELGWKQKTQSGRNSWTGLYEREGTTLKLHARSGEGDVVIQRDGHRIIAESKSGPLVYKKGSPERVKLAAAVGQALLFDANPDDVVLAAVPDSAAFRRLAEDWRGRPLIKKAGIFICLVDRSGKVSGFPGN